MDHLSTATPMFSLKFRTKMCARRVDSDLNSHCTILDSFQVVLLLYKICNKIAANSVQQIPTEKNMSENSFASGSLSQRKTSHTIFSFILRALFISLKFLPALSLVAFHDQNMH